MSIAALVALGTSAPNDLRMEKPSFTSRAAKVTAEHEAEAQALRAIWDAKIGKPSQEDFGATYDIGTQGAVWRFINGRDPLSLKAARGFAIGLGCRIEEFSPRLAAAVGAIAIHSSQAEYSAEVAQLAADIQALPQQLRIKVVKASRDYVAFATSALEEAANLVSEVVPPSGRSKPTTPSRRSIGLIPETNDEQGNDVRRVQDQDNDRPPRRGSGAG